MIDYGYFIVKNVRVAVVAVNPPFEPAGFDFEHSVDAAAILTDPSSDRIAWIGRLDVLGPVPSVSKNASRRFVTVQHISGLRRHNELQRLECRHHIGHAAVHAAGAVKIVALATEGLIGNAFL